MLTTFDSIYLNFDYFLLLILRVSGLLISSPIFGRKNIPNTAKIAFCIMLSYLMFVAFPPVRLAYTHLFGYAMMAILELLFGVAMGYVTTLFFQLTFTAGQIIDMQIGFGMVNLFDPSSDMNIPITGSLLNLIMLISFFVVNGHHKIIAILYSTISTIPIGQVTLSFSIAGAALMVFSLAFMLAVNVAMPIIVSGILGEAVLGLLIRTVPQLNVFVVGIPVKIVIGLIMLIFMVPIFVFFTQGLFDRMFEGMETMFRNLMGVA